MDFVYNVNDLETFINGLRFSFDQLENADPLDSQGFQSQFAKAISILQSRKKEMIEQDAPFKSSFSKTGIKNVLLEQLHQMRSFLEHVKTNQEKKFELLLKINKLTGKLDNL